MVILINEKELENMDAESKDIFFNQLKACKIDNYYDQVTKNYGAYESNSVLDSYNYAPNLENNHPQQDENEQKDQNVEDIKPEDSTQPENKAAKSKKKDKDETLSEVISQINSNNDILNKVDPEGVFDIDPEKIDEFLSEIANLFDQEAVEDLAKESGFVKRRSKLTGHLFMTVFTFGINIYGSPTLNQLVGLLDLVAGVDIKRQALQQRIKEEAVEFFSYMLGMAINISLPDECSINILDCFERVMILDSTAFQLPPKLAPYFAGSGGSASVAGVKIQFAYDLKSSHFVCLIQDGKTPDNRYDNSFVRHILPGDFNIRDLGYSNTQVFIDMDEKGAYFLSRLKSDLKVYIKNDDQELIEFDLDKYLSKMSSTLEELEVYLKKDKQEVRVRLVIEKAPQEVKEGRLRKRKELNKKKGKTTSKRTKLREGFNLYISNVPEKMVRFSRSEYDNYVKLWPEVAKKLKKYTYERKCYTYIDLVKAKKEGAVEIGNQASYVLKEKEEVILAAKGFRYIYGVRWQIELIFKNWKSNFDLDEIRVKNNECMVKCTLYAKLMYIFLSMKLTFVAKSWLFKTKQKEVSELQAGQHFKIVAFMWMIFAIHAPFLIASMLKRTIKFLMDKCVKSKKKDQLLPLEILSAIQLFL